MSNAELNTSEPVEITVYLRRCTEALEKLEAKLTSDQFREKQIDKLHAELEAHRQGLVDRLLQPLVAGLVRLHDDVGRFLTALDKESAEKMTSERFRKWIDSFRDDLELILDHGGIQLYTEPGPVFNLHRQLVQQTIATTDPTLVGQVAERLRPGFERQDRVLQKERVAVYVKAEATVSTPNQA